MLVILVGGATIAYSGYSLVIRREVVGQEIMIAPGLAVICFAILLLKYPRDFHAYLEKRAGRQVPFVEEQWRMGTITTFILGGMCLWLAIAALRS